MKIVKCGRYEDVDYCVVKVLVNRKLHTFQYDVNIDVTHDPKIQTWLKRHKQDDDLCFFALTKGVVSVGMNGKPKTKFRDRMFAKFSFIGNNNTDISTKIHEMVERIFEFRIRADLECVDQ